MITNQISQYNSSNFHGNSIIKSLSYSALIFLVLLFVSSATGFNFGLNLWFGLISGLLIFSYYESQERKKFEKIYYKGYYPAEYSYYKSFLIVMISLYFFVVFFNQNLLIQVFSACIIGIIASIIAVVPYLRSQTRNQNIELFIQKRKLLELSQKVVNLLTPSVSQQDQKPRFDTQTGKPLFDSTQIERKTFQVRFDSQTGKPINLQKQTETEEATTDEYGTALTDRELIRRVEKISRDEYEDEIKKTGSDEHTRTFQPVTTNQSQNSSTSIASSSGRTISASRPQTPSESSTQLIPKLIENIKENFAGYLFFGAIIFLFIAGLAWVLVFFPQTSQISIGVQTWIAGDTVVIFGILIVLISEFILGKSRYSDFIPINYLGIGVGLGISIIGLLSIRFDVLSVFLTETGLIDKNLLFFMLATLVSILSWIYAWRSPYRDLIFGSLISGFILVDYSLQFKFSLLVLAGLTLGLSFIFLPGLHASLVETQDNRFFLGGLIVFGLMLLKVENILAIVGIDPLVYAGMVILPVVFFGFLFSLKKFDNLYLILCFPISAFMLVINELNFMNNYISSEIFSLVFLVIVILFSLPKIAFKQHNLYTLLILALNAITITSHIIIGSLGWIPINNWIIILLPVTINFIIFIYQIRVNEIKLEYLIVLFALTIVTLGLHFDTIGLVLIVICMGLILTLLSVRNEESIIQQISFLIISLLIVIVGSNFSIFELWETVSIAFTIPIVVVFALFYKNTSKDILKPVIGAIMLTLTFLTFTQSIFATYIMIEYFGICFLFGLYLIVQKHRVETDVYYWFLLYIGFIGTLVYAEYDLLLVYFCFIALSVQSFAILLLYVSELSQKRLKQVLYDAANITIFTSLFAVIILEKFNNEFFLLTLGLFLLANVIIVWILLRYSGMDFTVAILLPALLVIGKELFVTQYLAQEIDPLYSLIEFLLVTVSGFCLALLSRRITEYEALITPNISAMFSVEMVLIVLFVNKVIVNYNALGTFLLLLTILIIANFVQKQSLHHIEFLLIIVSSIILAIVLPITQTIDKIFLYLLLGSLPVFWFIMRFKIKKVYFIPDGIVFVCLVIAEYILSLQLPNDTFIQAGLIAQQIIVVLALMSFILQSKSLSKQGKFKTLILLQLPFWISGLIFYDLDSDFKILYSTFTDFRPLTDLAILKTSILVLFVLFFMIYLLNNFETDKSLENILIIGVTSLMTLGLLLVQSFISQFVEDSIVNGLIVVGLLLIVQIVGILLIKNKTQLLAGNQLVLVGSFYTVVTIAVFLLDNGLISGLLAILGTSLIVLGMVQNFRKEIQLIGAFYIVFSISKIVFDILNNFNVLVFEIAISSSILAICLLLLGMIANYKMNRSERLQTQ